MTLGDWAQLAAGVLGGAIAVVAGLRVLVKALKPVAAATPSKTDDQVLDVADKALEAAQEAMEHTKGNPEAGQKSHAGHPQG